MRKLSIGLLAAVAVAGTPAAAAEGWVKYPEGNQCRQPELGLHLSPYYEGATIVIDAWAGMLLVSEERDVAIEVRFAEGPAGPEITTGAVLLPGQGVLDDGTTALRVSVDGAVMRDTPRDDLALVEWSAADTDTWFTALGRGEQATVEFLDKDGAVLRTRRLALARVRQAPAALKAVRWTC